ncbi:MAG: hypothetical protein HFF38_08730 [Lawsonibacter sp.]|nr:hypothetical protein [Lawsonibacter sp.]
MKKIVYYLLYYVGVMAFYSVLDGYALYASIDASSIGMIAAYLAAMLPLVLYFRRSFSNGTECVTFLVRNFFFYCAGAAALWFVLGFVGQRQYVGEMDLHVLSFSFTFVSQHALRTAATLCALLFEPRYTWLFTLLFPLYVCTACREKLERMLLGKTQPAA